MKLFALYFRSRSVGYSVAGLSSVAFTAWIIGRVLLTQPWVIPEKTLIPVLLFAPLAAACIVGVSTHRPFKQLEEASSYPIPVLRFLHIVGLLVCGCLLLYVVASEWRLPDVDLSMIRNFLGLAGIALFASWVLGSGLAWTAPLLYVAVVQLAGQDQDGSWALWAWPPQLATSVSAGLLATLLLIAGIATVSFGTLGVLDRFQWTQPS